MGPTVLPTKVANKGMLISTKGRTINDLGGGLGQKWGKKLLPSLPGKKNSTVTCVVKKKPNSTTWKKKKMISRLTRKKRNSSLIINGPSLRLMDNNC